MFFYEFKTKWINNSIKDATEDLIKSQKSIGAKRSMQMKSIGATLKIEMW